MKTSLSANLRQHLKMTPQLQQSIKLLQLSTTELQQEIQHQLELNPLLDIAANEELDNLAAATDIYEHTDFQWSHLYSTHTKTGSFNQSEYPYESLHATTVDLKEHLLWQLNLCTMSNKDRCIAITLIDALDDNGLLTVKPQELYADLSKEIGAIQIAEGEVVRHRLQRFDPIGCAAINLAETLIIQLKQLPQPTPHLKLTQQIIQEHIDWIGQHQYSKLLQKYHIDKKMLGEILTLIQHLNPRPGNVIQHHNSEYITPDLIVKKSQSQWVVELTPHILPQLSINDYYAALIKKNDRHDRQDFSLLRNNLQEARCFLKNIKNRQETLLRVARYIVQFQKSFFEIGERAMKPLKLSDVAQALNLHESTISRATTQKFIHTPRGLFELKYFFSNAILTNKNAERSSIAIRTMIQQLIAKENTKKPLSDMIIAGILSKQGIKIARRTVTKYREKMGIAPSAQRKSIQH